MTAYSLRNASTGLLTAARTVRMAMMHRANNSVPAPQAAKTHQLMVVLYTKPSNHRCMAHQASGAAITKAMTVRIRITVVQ